MMTLATIAKSNYSNFEVIVVDDASREEERVEYLQQHFPFLKVFRIEEDEKWYINPCIVYNKAIAKATGDIIIIQNPECLHIGDVVSFIAKNVTDSDWLSVSTYAFNFNYTYIIQNEGRIPDFRKLPQCSFNGKMGLGWYNHPEYRPVHYHFCVGITRKSMEALGGFDERYAMGYAYDDDELVTRAKRLGLTMKIITDVTVIHQYHDKERGNKERHLQAIERNKRLFYEVTSKEHTIKVKNSYEKV